MPTPPFQYKPLYLMVKEAIDERIADGLYRPGELIPSETALAEEFSLRVSTMQQALSVLVAEERLVKKQGRGTFVSQQKIPLRFFTWLPESPQGEEVIRAALGRVTERYPELEIELLKTSYPRAKSELLALISGGIAPDVAQIVTHWTSYFASM
jgi:DNA-binding transcriptional regulator YhcF (GntR family)